MPGRSAIFTLSGPGRDASPRSVRECKLRSTSTNIRMHRPLFEDTVQTYDTGQGKQDAQATAGCIFSGSNRYPSKRCCCHIYPAGRPGFDNIKHAFHDFYGHAMATASFMSEFLPAGTAGVVTSQQQTSKKMIDHQQQLLQEQMKSPISSALTPRLQHAWPALLQGPTNCSRCWALGCSQAMPDTCELA